MRWWGMNLTSIFNNKIYEINIQRQATILRYKKLNLIVDIKMAGNHPGQLYYY
jgi:hypothetical protein